MEKENLETAASAEETRAAVKPDYKAEILDIIRSNASPKVLCDRLEDYHENDIAEVLPDLAVTERRKLYRVMPANMISGILEYT